MEVIQSIVNIEVSFHFKKRLIQRMHGKHMAEKEMREFIRLTNTRLVKECHDIFSKSTFIWKGSFVAHHPESSYFLYDNKDRPFVVVANQAQTKLITLYPVEFDLPLNIEMDFIEKTVQEMRRAQKKWSGLHKLKAPILSRKRKQITTLEKKIAFETKCLEHLKDEVAEELRGLDEADKEATRLAKLLCMSKQFQKEMVSYNHSQI